LIDNRWLKKMIRMSSFYIAYFVAATSLSSAYENPTKLANNERRNDTFKILFGSCAEENTNIPIFKAINKEKSDLFIFLGDNIYADTTDMNVMKKKYQQLGKNKGFMKLRRTTDVLAIWDDHDYGQNDAGAEYPKKEQSKQLFLNFWNISQKSPRSKRSDGIYTSKMIGKDNHKIHIIMPDLRWNRTPLKAVSKKQYETVRKINNMGPYRINTDKTATMIGEKQWQWLENELKKPAAITIIASSLQVIPHFTGWESWSNFPQDRNKLIKLIKKYRVNAVLFISGDTHWGELSRYQKGMDYPIWEITSSGLTKEWKHVSPNQFRQGKPYDKVNYGEISIQWGSPSEKNTNIYFSLNDLTGHTVFKQKIPLATISPYH